MRSLKELFPDKNKQILLTISVYENEGKDVAGRSLWIPSNMNMFEVLGHISNMQTSITGASIKKLPQEKDVQRKDLN